MITKPAFITEPHGAHEVTVEVSEDNRRMIGDWVITITADKEYYKRKGKPAQTVSMTGLELESLCKWWNEVKNKETGCV